MKHANFDLDNRMTVVLFAGLGGGCDGLEAAGFHVHLAVNHDPIAVAVHERRHPHTRHLRCDVYEVCPREATRGRGVRILHASPDCTHFSVAKGGKPVSPRRRSLAWVVCRWAGTVRPETITLENVSEIQTWGPLVAKRDPATGRVLRLDGTVAAKGEVVPVREQWLVPDPRHRGRIWRAWLRHLRGLGYSFEGRVLVCADYGVPTIRKRFFGVARADGGPIEWPERTHAPRDKARALRLRPWVGAHTCIDWSVPMRSIFGRPKPLAEATLRRTARGIVRYVLGAKRPFIVPITHSCSANRGHWTDEPLRTITTAHRGEMAVIAPALAKWRTHADGGDLAEPMPTVTANSFERRPGGAIPLGVMAATMVASGYGERDGQAPRALVIADPSVTQVAGGAKAAIVAAHLIGVAHGDSGGRREYDAEDPLNAVQAGGGNAALVAAFLQQHNDGPHANFGARDQVEPLSTLTTSAPQQGVAAVTLGRMRGSDVAGQDIRQPLPAVMAGGNHAALILGFLQHYYSSGGQDQSLDDPLGAVTAKARHGLVTVRVGGTDYVMTDILIRMLEPEEGAAAHGFAPGALPSEITIDGRTRQLTKTEKYHLVGNSVPPRMIQLLAEANGRRALTVEAAE